MSTVCPALVLFGQGDEDAAAFQEAVFAYGHLGHLLWCHFQETDLKKQGLFTCTSKTHAICHSALLSRYLNPRLVWCFIGEDMMSTVQQLTQACTKGNTPLSGPMKSLEHWRLAMHLEWQSWKRMLSWDLCIHCLIDILCSFLPQVMLVKLQSFTGEVGATVFWWKISCKCL